MGVKGFKVDFMDRDDQELINFLYRSAETCARYKMLVDFHGICKPTGLQRTYPNVINYEGVNGLEQLKWSPASYDMVTYDVTFPFIRMVAGPVDYTQGAMRNATRANYRPVNSEPMSQGTRCRQLATYVIFESPNKFLIVTVHKVNLETFDTHIRIMLHNILHITVESIKTCPQNNIHILRFGVRYDGWKIDFRDDFQQICFQVNSPTLIQNYIFDAMFGSEVDIIFISIVPLSGGSGQWKETMYHRSRFGRLSGYVPEQCNR